MTFKQRATTTMHEKSRHLHSMLKLLIYAGILLILRAIISTIKPYICVYITIWYACICGKYAIFCRHTHAETRRQHTSQFSSVIEEGTETRKKKYLCVCVLALLSNFKFHYADRLSCCCKAWIGTMIFKNYVWIILVLNLYLGKMRVFSALHICKWTAKKNSTVSFGICHSTALA